MCVCLQRQRANTVRNNGRGCVLTVFILHRDDEWRQTDEKNSRDMKVLKN